ncbi:MAG TPA: protein kinase [Iamia sp.]
MGSIDATTQPPRGALSGRRVHGQTLGGLLGRGAFAEVYAVEPATGERLAVKAILVRSGQAELIAREIDALRAAQHPNILRYLWHERGTGDLEGFVFVATEQCETSLAGALESTPPGPERIEAAWRVVPRMVNDALGGLLYLHGLAPSVIHRDVKPDNILRSPSGVWRIADLGIAKVLDPDQSIAVDPTVAFTPGFTAPDLIRRGEITVAADIFGLGATIQWAFTGMQPWPALPIHVLIEHIRRSPPLVSPDLPVEWRPFVSASFEIDPRARLRWSYPSLVSWQPGNVPTGQRAEPTRPRPAVDAGARPLTDADRTTVIAGSGPTVVAPGPRPAPLPSSTPSAVRTAVIRGAVTFIVVLLGLAAFILVNHRT